MRKHPAALCEECPLQSQKCAPTQHAKGTPRAAIVSRSPAWGDALAKKPFTGPSGKVLDHLLKINGVERDEVMVTNTVLCTLPKNAKDVPSEAIKACAPRLDQELQGIDLVIACGREAVNEIVGRGTIDKYRGYRINQKGRTVVATNNPALVLYKDETFPDLKTDFRRAFNPKPPPVLPTIEVIEDAKDARDYISSLRKLRGRRISTDIESRGGITHKATLISMQYSIDGNVATVLGERGGLWEDRDFLENYLRPFHESTDHTFVWHGGKFDCKILRHSYGINARVDEDTMLLSYALDERSGGDEHVGVHGLDYLLMDTFGWPYYSSPEIEQMKKTGVITDYDAFYRYAGMDCAGTYQLHEDQYPKADADNVLRHYERLLLRGTELAIKIELTGMPYDVNRAADLYEFEVQPELQEKRKALQDRTGNPAINPASPTQMAKLYYDDYGATHDLRNRRGQDRSVDDSARKEILEDRFELTRRYEQAAGKIKQYEDYEDRKEALKSIVEIHDRFQSVQKQGSTYLIGMIKRAEPDKEHRIYTQLNFHGTNSGRLSSSKPNLQNITRSSQEGLPDIRKLFKASEGRLIVNADFSQAELRCIAQFSGDKELSRIYYEGLSLHKETATRFYGESYLPEDYQTAKNVNFGAFYRQSAETFQEKHGIPKDKAQAYIDWLWQTFEGVAEWERGIEREVHTGELVSPFGRKRRFRLILDSNVQGLYREAINFYPQSTASDFTLCAAIRIGEEIDWSRASIGVLVHDSIVGDVVEEYVDEYSTVVKQIMEETPKYELGWEIPFAAEIGVGPTWGECK